MPINVNQGEHCYVSIGLVSRHRLVIVLAPMMRDWLIR
jgi:hypothetical protein